MKQEYAKTSQEVMQELNTTPQGLPTAEVQKRQQQYGPNKLKDGEKKCLFRRF